MTDSKKSKVIIEDVEELEVTPEIQRKMDELAKLLDEKDL